MEHSLQLAPGISQPQVFFLLFLGSIALLPHKTLLHTSVWEAFCDLSLVNFKQNCLGYSTYKFTLLPI